MTLVSALRFGLAVFAALAFAACGGGGGGTPGGGGGGGGGAVNRAPTAVAGSAQTGAVGDLLTFNGGGSSDPDGNSLTYAWSISSAPSGSTAMLGAATSATPTLRPDRAGSYILSLIVSDGSLASNAATTTGTANVEAAQGAARLTATFIAETSTLQLNWTDSFAAGSSYRIEQRNADGSFTALETIAGVGGVNGAMQWTRPYTAPVIYRVIGITAGRELPLLSPGGLSALAITAPSGLAIEFTQTEPVAGNIQISVANAPAGATFAWYQNLVAIGTGNPVTWITASLANGTRLLQAIISIGGDVSVDLRRQVSVSNTPLAVTVQHTVGGRSAEITVSASSSSGITGVQLSGMPGGAQTLAAPNACTGACGAGAPNNVYRFTFSNLALAAYNYTVTATDGAGATRSRAGSFTIAPSPVTLTLATPIVGSFHNGTLNISGMTTSSPGNTVTVTASLGAVQFLNTTASNFIGSFNLAGLPAGPYTLTVVANGDDGGNRSIQRRIIVTSTAALAYQPQMTISQLNLVELAGGRTARIFAASDNVVVFQIPEQPGGSFFFNAATGFIGSIGNPTSLTQRNTVATDDAVYVYNNRYSATTGAVTDISGNVPADQRGFGNLRLRGNYLAWSSSVIMNNVDTMTALTLYNLPTGVVTKISPPNGQSFAGINFGMALVAGDPMAFFWSRTAGVDTLYKWTAAAGAVPMQTLPAGETPLSVQTDGLTYAWSTRIPGGNRTFFKLSQAPVGGGAATVIADQISTQRFFDGIANPFNLIDANYELRDGILAVASSGYDAPGEPTQFAISQTHSASLSSTAWSTQRIRGGYYGHAAGTENRIWNGATGARLLRIEGGAVAMFMTDNYIWFSSAEGLYRIPLT